MTNERGQELRGIPSLKDLMIIEAINLAKLNLEDNVKFEIRGRPQIEDLPLYKTIVGLSKSFNELTEEEKEHKIVSTYGIAWYSNDEMQDKELLSIDLNAKYDPETGYCLIARLTTD